LNGILNDYFFVPCCDVPVDETWFAVSVLFDIRGDLGYDSDRGLKPMINQDYQQIGTKAGLAVSIERINSDLSATETYLWANNRKNISLFQAGWTYNFSKDIGLKASFQNGNIETTAQRTQQWLISISVKY
jgi:hypothetical protein